MIAHDAIEGVRAHGDGAVVLLHTWPGGTGERIGPMIARTARHRRVVRVDRRAGRSAVSRRPAILAVDAGGSKTDVALLRRDGTLLGAARVRSHEIDGRTWLMQPQIEERHLVPVGVAIQEAARQAGIDADRLPIADLGVYCLAGADLPADDRRLLRWLRSNGWTETEVLRNDTFAVLRAGTDRPWGVGVVCGYGTNCSAVAPGRPDHAVPGDRPDLRRLGRRRRPRRTGRLARRALGGRPRTEDRAGARRARALRAASDRGSSWRPSTSGGSTSSAWSEVAPVAVPGGERRATPSRARSSIVRPTRS